MSTEQIEATIVEWIGMGSVAERITRINMLQNILAAQNPCKHPVANVQWVPVETVHPNGYNPNSVANREMALLKTSIMADGYTQPVVTAVMDDGREIVDGFHRFFCCSTDPTINDSTHGHLPVVQIATNIGSRMEATVRHNRARGRHSLAGMTGLVFSLLEEGYTEQAIMDRLGMEAAEVARLTHISGFSKLLQDHTYSKALASRRMILLAKEHNAEVL